MQSWNSHYPTDINLGLAVPDIFSVVVWCVVSGHTQCSLACVTVKMSMRELNLVHITRLHVLWGKRAFCSVLIQSLGLNQINPRAESSVLM